MKCWIDKEAARGMLVEGNDKDPLETGGCLMGYWASEREVVVCYIVGPGAKARHQRHNFDPDHEIQTQEVGDIYDATEGMITYLGDWHTHPGGHPFPSALDIETLGTIADNEEARAPKPLMIILGGFGSFSHKSAYVLIDGFTLSTEVIDFDYKDQVELGRFCVGVKTL